MIGDMSRRASWLLLLSAAIVVCAFGGSALAAGNSISIKVPTNATVNKPYLTTISGYASTSERLYYFVDPSKCGANPYVEHAVHDVSGFSPKVDRSFKFFTQWGSPRSGTDYFCAYLVKGSEPKNSPNGVLLRASKSFKVS